MNTPPAPSPNDATVAGEEGDGTDGPQEAAPNMRTACAPRSATTTDPSDMNAASTGSSRPAISPICVPSAATSRTAPAAGSATAAVPEGPASIPAGLPAPLPS